MYYIKKQYIVSDAHRALIQDLAKSSGKWTAEDHALAKSLCDIYQINWWMAFQDGSDGTEARAQALRQLLHVPHSMIHAVAGQVFRKALSQRTGIQQMLAAIYEEVTPGTEQEYCVPPAPIDWAKEIDHLSKLRGLAIVDLYKMNIPMSYMPIQKTDDGYCLIRKHGGHSIIVSKGSSAGGEDLTDLDDAALLKVLVAVQKAIAGGQQP
jgi:hypothetical protein